jgi:uncharacterized membrane protein
MDPLEKPGCDDDGLTSARVERAWALRRNCCASPRQFLAGIGSLIGLLCLLGIVFFVQGLWIITAFCLIDVVLVACSAIAFVSHALDGERIALLDDGRIIVEIQDGPSWQRHALNRNWARVIRTLDRPHQLWIQQGAFRYQVAKHVRPGELAQFERELRRALPWRGSLDKSIDRAGPV